MPPPVERRESCKESTVLLASGESTPRSPDAQRRSSLQELRRLMTAEEALLAAEAAILFKVAGLPGPDYYSTRAESPRISCARRARPSSRTGLVVPAWGPAQPPICGHIVVTQTHLSCVTAHSGRRFDPAALDQHVWVQAHV